MSNPGKTLIWLRTSIRVCDNPLWSLTTSLNHADSSQVVLTPCYVQDEQHGYGHRRTALKQKNIEDFVAWADTVQLKVTVLSAGTYREAAAELLHFIANHGITELWADREYGLNERRRDAWVGKQLAKQNIAFQLSEDRLTFPPQELLTQQHKPYQVYSAFKKAWRARWQTEPQLVWPMPQWAQSLPAMEQQAQDALNHYVACSVGHYDERRNDLEPPVMSGLSPFNTIGLLNTRQAFAATASLPPNESITTWLDEWIWREFFYAVGYHFPDVYRRKALQAWTDGIAWHASDTRLQAWQAGQTGYPIIDAAMRQLEATGRMPNRARMFTAAFLVKDLHIDWRHGESWFLQQLHDADFAVNNGNWQWGASTGVDAAPYFRVFNPLRQAERFDPEGDYVRAWVPELAHITGKAIHDPSPEQRQAAGYPAPIVIHKDAAAATKALFSAAKKEATAL